MTLTLGDTIIILFISFLGLGCRGFIESNTLAYSAAAAFAKKKRLITLTPDGSHVNQVSRIFDQSRFEKFRQNFFETEPDCDVLISAKFGWRKYP